MSDIFSSFLPLFWVLCAVLPYFVIKAAFRRDNATDWLQLKRLSDQGVNLEAPREVEFMILVRTELSAAHAAKLLADEGFATRFEKGGYHLHNRGIVKEQDEGYLVWARKTLVLYGDATKVMRKKLTELASKENGKYLGWKAVDESVQGSSEQTEA